jgi:lipopolysaccharide transport system permease protein
MLPDPSRELLTRYAPGHPDAPPCDTGLGKELWRHRELFFFLAWRDTLVRYKQTAIGIAWAAIKAVVTLTVLAIVFGKLARLPSHGAPYPLMVLAAILPWQFLSSALTDAGSSLVNNSDLVSKVYFPRMIIPASAVVVNLVDLFIAGLVLAVLFVWYGMVPDWRVLALPFFVALAVAIALGAGFWFAALTAQYRDFRHVLALLLQLGLYVSPVGFSSSLVPQPWYWLFALNPTVGVIEGFRWALLRGESAALSTALPLSILVTTLLLLTGVRYYRMAERRFADVI